MGDFFTPYLWVMKTLTITYRKILYLMYIGIISKRMGKAKKFYVVWEGNNPGIYNSWTECQLQIIDRQY